MSTAPRTPRTRVVARSVLAAVVSCAIALVSFPLSPAQADTRPLEAGSATLPATVSADALPTWQLTGVVWSQVLVGNTVYATGNFTKARPAGMWAGGPTEINVSHLFAYDIRTGERIAGFDHSLNAQGLAITASPDGSRVYVGGDFTAVDDQVRQHVAAFDTATGNLVSNWSPVVNGQVKALSATSSTLYVGGGFGSAGGVARKNLAALATSNGALKTWAPTADNGYVWSLLATPDGANVVIGGQFSTLSGATVTGMGAVDATTGATRPWAANSVIKDSNKGAINSLTTDGTYVYGSGFAFGTGGYFEGSFSLNPADGSIRWLVDCQGDTYDVEPIGDVVYTVSHSHNCTMIGQFPDTSPRVRWQHAGAYTSYATGVNKGPDTYGWNYKNQPAPTMLHWYPDLGIGTATGQYQAAWTIAGNASYVAMAGEFPTVNGKPQSGLTRFAVSTQAPNTVGPQYDTLPARTVPATTATALSSGGARISFGTAWDRDNQNLTYDVYRDKGTAAEKKIKTVQASTNFWTLPTLTVSDGGAPAGDHTYRVRITDEFGNELLSPVSNTVTVTSSVGAYGSRVVQDGASSYWRLGETSGSTAYDIVGGADAAKQSGVTFGAAGALAGDSNKAATFSGTTSGYLGAGSTATGAPSTFTTEAWFKTTSTKGGKIIGFGSAKTGSSTSYDRQVYLANNGKVVFGVSSNANKVITSPTAYNNGAWHQVTASLSSAGMELYVDGILIGTDSSVTSAASYNGYWRIGGDNLSGWPSAPTSGYLAGSIDDVAVYPAALTLAEVKNHYQLGGGTVANVAPVAAIATTGSDLRRSFSGTGSTDSDGTISSYAWDFGDTKTGTGATPEHTYASAGTYTVKLTVTDNSGGTGSTTKTVTVTNAAPTAAFTSSSSGNDASFDGTGSADVDGTIASYAWDFGDTKTGTGSKPKHTYASAGTYTVKLTVNDNAGGTGTKSGSVTIAAANQSPTAVFTSSSDDLAASFDASGSTDPDGTIASYAWDFGDTKTGTGSKPNHTYASAGTYTVKLTITDDDAASDTVSHDVTITGPLAKDGFDRTVSKGWGSADVGGSWTLSGSSSLFAVDNGTATIALNAAASGPSARLSGVASTDTDLQVDFSFDKAPTGGGQFAKTVVRGDTSNGYVAKVWMSSTGKMTLYVTKIISGTETDLASKVISGMTFAPGQSYSVRVQAWGTTPTTVRAKLWATSGSEPSAWAVTGTDATASLQSAGGIAVRGYLSGSATSAPVIMSVTKVSAQATGN